MSQDQDITERKRRVSDPEAAHVVRTRTKHSASTTGVSFAGRIGGNQTYTISRNDDDNASVLHREPDKAPGMTFKQQFDLRGFQSLGLWKAAMTEGFATMFLVFLTAWANISPNLLPTKPTAQLGYFDNAAYLGPATGGISNFLILTLLTFIFAVISGAHFNPTITLATFFARLCTLPRAVLYIGFQVLGASLGGLFVRAGYGTRDFKVGGCWLFPDVVSPLDAFAVEFVASSTLIFLAFGVGLDPRQQKIIPPSLAPFLVGLSLGTLSWMTGYSRYGYGGASLNPARCFGVFVGSHFPYWHWFQWSSWSMLLWVVVSKLQSNGTFVTGLPISVLALCMASSTRLYIPERRFERKEPETLYSREPIG